MTTPMGRRPSFWLREFSRAKRAAPSELCLGDVRRDRLSRRKVQPDPPVLVALLVERDGRLLAVLVEVFDSEATRRADPGSAIEEELDDGPISIVEHRVAGGEPHELPGTGRRQGLRLVARIGRAPGNELGVGRIGNRDRQPKLGGDTLEVLVEDDSVAIRRLMVLGALDSASI